MLNEELRIDGNEHVLLPPNSRLGAAMLDHVWLIEKDEFDVESIVRYVVTWPASAPSRQQARTQ